MTHQPHASPQLVTIAFDGPLHAGPAQGALCDAEAPGMVPALTLLMKLFAVSVITGRNPARVSEWLSPRGFSCWIDMGETQAARLEWADQGFLLVTPRPFPALATIGGDGLPFTTWDSALRELGAIAGPEMRAKAARITSGG